MNTKLLTILTAVLSIIGIVLCAFVVMSIGDDGALNSSVSNIVTYSLLLLGLAVVVSIVGSLLGMFKNPAALKKALFGLGGLAVVLLVSYFIAGEGEVLGANGEVLAAAKSSVSKLTSTGIWVSSILLLLGGAFFVIDLAKGLVKS